MPVDPLSFCLVATFYPPASFGGDAIHLQRLARGLVRRGHRVRVVHNPTAHRMLARGPAERASSDLDDGVEVVAAPAGAVATAGTYMTGLPLGYRRTLDTLTAGFDVVNLSNTSLIGGPGALSLGDGIRLYTAQEHWLLCPTHVLFRYGREVCTKRTCFTCTLAHRRPPQPWRATGLLDRSVAALDALVCPSRYTARLHRERFPDANIEVLHLLGPGTPADERQEREETGAALPFFLYAGRLEPIKGVDTLVRAFRDVVGAELAVVGEGSQERMLKDLAGGRPAIKFCGRLPNDRVLELSRTARALIVPSAGLETFGIAAVEAMSRGAPVVVRDLGPLPELVEGGGGLTFDTDTSLTAALQRLTDDPAEAARLGAEAREVADGRFGEQRFFRRYFEIIEGCAEAAGRPAVAEAARAALAGERA